MPAVVVVVVDHQPVLRLGSGILQPLRCYVGGEARCGDGSDADCDCERCSPGHVVSPCYSFAGAVIAKAYNT
jgi:hypothetical protein